MTKIFEQNNAICYFYQATINVQKLMSPAIDSRWGDRTSRSKIRKNQKANK